jgi:group I intron endonuclease
MDDKRSGIYRITCLVNGCTYVGKAQQFSSRWHFHRQSLDQRKHSNSKLQEDWLQYGQEAFEFVVIEVVDREAMGLHLWGLDRRERHWMAHYWKLGPCYNTPMGRRRCPECGQYRKSYSAYPIFWCECDPS